jgi:dTDP-4-dehydrorhamnose 3,5-epimerase
MRFEPTAIPGVCEIEVDIHADDRGSLARTYCLDEFREHGLELPDRQSAISRNRARATLRGLHFIAEDVGEAKLVRCVSGRVFDVAVDLRRGSATFGRHVAAELSADKANALYIPRGVAHGFITLEDGSDILYQFSQPHRAGLEKGVRWDDPDIAIAWPLVPAVLSERDRSLPRLADLAG